MSADQPFNRHCDKYGQPITGMVLISGSKLVRNFRGRVSMAGDLALSASSLARVRKATEDWIAAGEEPTKDEVRSAHESWTLAVLAYGRCFMSSDGRKPLTVNETKRMGGDAAAHNTMMQDRHSQAAHVTLDKRRIEVFAEFGDRPNGGVTNLATIESYSLLPEISALRDCEAHVVTLKKALDVELGQLQLRIVNQLNERHLSELRTCFDERTPWL